MLLKNLVRPKKVWIEACIFWKKSLLESSFFLWRRHLQVVERDHLPTRFHREETWLEMSQLHFLFLLRMDMLSLVGQVGHLDSPSPLFWAVLGPSLFSPTSHHSQDTKDQRQALSKEMHESAQQMWLEHFPHNCRWSFYLLQYPKRVCLSCVILEKDLEGVVKLRAFSSPYW